MTDRLSRRTEQIQRDELALIAAGFAGRKAHALATLNWWLLPFTLIMAVATLAWVGVHLWPDLDVKRWQAWTDENPGFLEPLRVGTTLAIVPELHSHAGLLIRKTREGILVERHIWFPFDEVPVGLVITPEAADQLLHLCYGDDDFWSQWESLARDEQISIFQHLSPASEVPNDYRAFLERLRHGSH